MNRPKCHSEHIINEWIEDVDVQVWSTSKKIDSEKYGQNPDYFVNSLISSRIVNPNTSYNNYLYIEKHSFDNLDNWLPFSDRS